MSSSAIVPLNLLVEFLSECADVRDFDSLLRVAGGRMRWILGFERCTVGLQRGKRRLYWRLTQAEDSPHQIAADEVPAAHATLLARAFESGTLGSAGWPINALCAPLISCNATFGAICFTTERAPYTDLDTRLVHHIAQCLSSTIVRLDLARQVADAGQRKDEFLALLSHELRNPLAPIVTAVHLLKLDSQIASRKELAVIERQAGHLLRLIDDLLDISRLTRGQVVLHKAPTEIGAIIARAIELASPLMEHHGHHLHVAVPPVGLVIAADIDRLAQVFSNLLNNAARYTDAGGQINVAARRDQADVVVEISDTGIGIGKDTLPRVFDQFLRGPAAAERAQGGLGLGLSIVKTLTELHGGAVGVASEGSGHGTRFSIRLPALPDESVASTKEPATVGVAPAEQPQRILLVDDNQDAGEMLAEILKAAGHEVEVALDGPQALSMIPEFHPSIAVLDIGLPVMSGYELAERLRVELGSDVPYLIALSGFGEESDVERGLAAGFARYLVKPVNANVVLQVIGEASASQR